MAHRPTYCLILFNLSIAHHLHIRARMSATQIRYIGITEREVLVLHALTLAYIGNAIMRLIERATDFYKVAVKESVLVLERNEDGQLSAWINIDDDMIRLLIDINPVDE